jgi:hypothetical protein
MAEYKHKWQGMKLDDKKFVFIDPALPDVMQSINHLELRKRMINHPYYACIRTGHNGHCAEDMAVFIKEILRLLTNDLGEIFTLVERLFAELHLGGVPVVFDSSMSDEIRGKFWRCHDLASRQWFGGGEIAKEALAGFEMLRKWFPCKG